MFKIIIKFTEVLILITLALISDIKTYKIKNIIVLPFILVGIITNFLISGTDGVVKSLLAIALPVLLLIILYALRMLGAGDIKLFSAVGAIMGVQFVLYTIAYSFISGGVIGVIIISIRKNGRQRLFHLLKYIKSCIITFTLLPYTDFTEKSDGSKFHFAYAIACGTLIEILILLHPYASPS